MSQDCEMKEASSSDALHGPNAAYVKLISSDGQEFVIKRVSNLSYSFLL